jgi:hypothetical protein
VGYTFYSEEEKRDGYGEGIREARRFGAKIRIPIRIPYRDRRVPPMPTNPQYDRKIKIKNPKTIMKRRTLESDTRLRYLLGNNPIGELVRIVGRLCRIQRYKKNKDGEVV